MKKIISLTAAIFLITTGIGTSVPIQADAASGIYKNCTTFNKQYQKGVAKSANTKNKVISRKTNKVSYKALSKGTKISSQIYKKAMKNNNDLDRDKDGIACER
ncbi:excalibur calcium-binding domain-containing protein [Peribacillus psychrosaccharolyticus]|uniref:Excalibur calcium-binding domain-containing protein n=1 Tax=Peribacillus psychrosaccharolyticus TaxID=1407 RepID=A0A974NMZ8_PERPY|nr:excalibur calcium-binding domain-containing protein [Peribacillus psychrosaccharolyticus]MEC2056100.1 excalibur calcium-binding domain-containing protein [Peribacillus psychrosaccharolyticus]MED3745541.1 excalibur calcium-binding domain-containing protein [Peribacillus psychrosaccharolyticus]QQT00706.1 excalibur calcium-binding domain-containing protein [Peribacillus psychrosaccharolyticus]